MNFQDELAKRTEETEKVIRSFLPAEAGFAGTMAQAMNYSMLAGGKRLRPMLIRETYRLFDGKEEVVKPFMAGMEMIHTHSDRKSTRLNSSHPSSSRMPSSA